MHDEAVDAPGGSLEDACEIMGRPLMGSWAAVTRGWLRMRLLYEGLTNMSYEEIEELQDLLAWRIDANEP